MKRPIVIFWILLAVLGGCRSTELEPVVGRLRMANQHLSNTFVLTAAQPGGGVRVSTNVGMGQRAVTLSATDTDRLIAVLESQLAGWSRIRSGAFRETLMGALVQTSRQNPMVVELARTSEMAEPVFLLSVGYYDTSAALVLDKKNAEMWAKTLRVEAGY